MLSRFIQVILLLTFLPLTSFAFQQESEIKLETYSVLIDTVVLKNRDKAVVGDLRPEDFIIREDGKEQKLTHFSREELPLSIVLLVDVSGSVQPILSEIQRAALDALDRLKPNDKVAVMVFASQPVLVAEFTQDHAVIAETLGHLLEKSDQAGGATYINTGVYEAAQYLHRHTSSSERRAIVMITDDEDTSRIGYGLSRSQILKSLYEDGITLCGITVGHSKVAQTVVRLGTEAAITAVYPPIGAAIILSRVVHKLSATTGSAKFYASQTGGVAISARQDEMAQAFVDLMTLLRTRYTIGYAPSNLNKDGKFRKIKVDVSNRVKKENGEVLIFARQGYYLSRPLDTTGNKLGTIRR
jgi:VWFA-related protein